MWLILEKQQVKKLSKIFIHLFDLNISNKCETFKSFA